MSIECLLWRVQSRSGRRALSSQPRQPPKLSIQTQLATDQIASAESHLLQLKSPFSKVCTSCSAEAWPATPGVDSARVGSPPLRSFASLKCSKTITTWWIGCRKWHFARISMLTMTAGRAKWWPDRRERPAKNENWRKQIFHCTWRLCTLSHRCLRWRSCASLRKIGRVCRAYWAPEDRMQTE